MTNDSTSVIKQMMEDANYWINPGAPSLLPLVRIRPPKTVS